MFSGASAAASVVPAPKTVVAVPPEAFVRVLVLKANSASAAIIYLLKQP
jgi:hypothetical protein